MATLTTDKPRAPQGATEQAIAPTPAAPAAPAIFQDRTIETTGPHRWQVQWWARLVRPVLWWFDIGRAWKPYMQPFTVLGRENLEGLTRPVIVIGNHTSHMDSTALYYALPPRLRRRLYFAAAADRWFIKGRKGIRKQGWYVSLEGSFPITRGGGRAALAHAEWLLDRGESIAIFPEGTRTRSGEMGRFKAGPAILAVPRAVPVVPMYFDGLAAIRAVGTRAMAPGPATVLIGAPIRFAPDTTIEEATDTLYEAVDALRRQLHGRDLDAEEAAPAVAG
jgi:1-acyl-sn-glycerol-3-phosphate acyltransferase